MKLRCVTNSIRLRLRKSDIHTLNESKSKTEVIQFPGSEAFTFKLSIQPALSEVSAKFEQNSLEVLLPEPVADLWITSNQVSIESHLQLANNNTLHLLIEKDFPCKDRDDEDKTDTFQELSQDHC